MNDMKEYDFGKPQSYSRENLTCLNFLLAEFCKKYRPSKLSDFFR